MKKSKKIYEEEKAKIEAQKQIEQEKVRKHMGAYLFGLLFVVIGFIFYITSGFLFLGIIGAFFECFGLGILGIIVGAIIDGLGFSKFINKLGETKKTKEQLKTEWKVALIIFIIFIIVLIGLAGFFYYEIGK